LASLIIRKVLGCVCVEREDEKDEGDEILSYHFEKPDEKIQGFSEEMDLDSKHSKKASYIE